MMTIAADLTAYLDEFANIGTDFVKRDHFFLEVTFLLLSCSAIFQRKSCLKAHFFWEVTFLAYTFLSLAFQNFFFVEVNLLYQCINKFIQGNLPWKFVSATVMPFSVNPKYNRNRNTPLHHPNQKKKHL